MMEIKNEWTVLKLPENTNVDVSYMACDENLKCILTATDIQKTVCEGLLNNGWSGSVLFQLYKNSNFVIYQHKKFDLVKKCLQQQVCYSHMQVNLKF